MFSRQNLNGAEALRFALRMAWREARASKGRFVFVILSIAAGVAALTSVKGFNESVRYTLLAEARSLMGADLTIRLSVEPTEEELAFLESLRDQGIDYTPVTETVSMSSSRARPQPLLSSIKAADLAVYPYYGTIEFDPPEFEMGDDAVIVSEDLLMRLDVGVGDRVRVSAAEFRIAAVARKEPDRMTTGFTLGPRVLMSRGGYELAGLNVRGSRATQRLLLRLPEGTDLEQTRGRIEEVFGRRARVSDFTEENRTLSRGLRRATTFLSLVSLIALIVGGIGVGSSIEGHVRQKMDSIAMIKCLGGQSGQVVRIYVAQAALLGLAGSLIGVVVGFGAQWVFPIFLEDYFDVDVQVILSAAPLIQGVLAGLLTALLFAVPPLLSITEIRPALIFRRDMSESRIPSRNWKPYAAFGCIGLGLWAMALWIGDSFEAGSIFAGGLIVSVLMLALVGKGMMLLIRRLLDGHSQNWHPALRYGVANLYRPGTHMVAILVALGIGVMFTLSVHLLQTALIERLEESAPPDMPNVYMINITDREKDGLWDLLERQPGVIEAPPAAPAVAGMLHKVKDIPVEEMNLVEGERRYLRVQFQLTWSDEQPAATEILEGQWWSENPEPGWVSVEENAAGILRLAPGDDVEWNVNGRIVGARVANVRRTDGTRAGANNQFILTPGTLDEFPGIYYGALRVEADQVGSLQRAVFASYPSVTVVNAADILEIVQELVGEISLTVRFVAAFALLGGLIILASSIAGTRYRRIREVAILKTVGARRARIVGVFSVEFFILGLTAGLLGSLLAAAFSAIVVVRLMDASYTFHWQPLLLATVLAASLAVMTGWAASYRILKQKPLEVLRRADS
jgi:putative ABC transport system permease protein